MAGYNKIYTTDLKDIVKFANRYTEGRVSLSEINGTEGIPVGVYVQHNGVMPSTSYFYEGSGVDGQESLELDSIKGYIKDNHNIPNLGFELRPFGWVFKSEDSLGTHSKLMKTMLIDFLKNTLEQTSSRRGFFLTAKQRYSLKEVEDCRIHTLMFKEWWYRHESKTLYENLMKFILEYTYETPVVFNDNMVQVDSLEVGSDDTPKTMLND